MSEAYVKTSLQNRVHTIEFFHPQSNSLPGVVLNDLARQITEAGKATGSTCIVLRSAGEKAFCAGASFDELTAITNAQQGLEFFSGFAKVINAIRTSPKFVVGRVQGKAVGGGVGVASAVDYCFATQAASVKLSELAIGIGPFVVGPAVERKMGKAAFTELATDASEWRSASWAKDRGLYTDIYNDAAAMDKTIAEFTARIAAYSPEAVAELKRVFWEGTEHWDTLLTERAKISGRLVLSEFTKSAIQAFKSKS